jgi:hypothetical protein
MEKRMYDISRLVTVRHYAELRGVVRETVAQWIRKDAVDSVMIDGVRFIILKPGEYEESEKV